MNLNDAKKKIIIQVVNVFETGTTTGDYGSISIFPDGPNDIKQITYGRSQTTEYSNLKELLEMYVNAGGVYSEGLRPYIQRIGGAPLVDDANLKQLLKDAGKKDPVMQQIQDEFFDKRYYDPAIKWAEDHGFNLPLSALVIYDSYIHSGGVPMFLRKRFPERTPSDGGSEVEYIKQYVDVRRAWLASHSKVILQKTVYRMDCFINEISRNNWDLTLLPIDAHGVAVGTGEEIA